MTEKNTTKIVLCLGYIIEGLLAYILLLYRLICIIIIKVYSIEHANNQFVM